MCIKEILAWVALIGLSLVPVMVIGWFLGLAFYLITR